MTTRTLASTYEPFKIRSDKVIFPDGEVYGCYTWTDLGDVWLQEYKRFFKANGVFLESRGVKTVDELLSHVQKCPTTVYKIWSKDRRHATKWCDSIESAFSVKRKIKQRTTKATEGKSKYELHLEDGVLWIIYYERTEPCESES